jgi:two-component system sensor histidine kinase AlgZ
MRIIKQNLPVTLPNFRNLGIMLRILVLVDGMSLAVAVVHHPDIAGIWQDVLESSAIVQPVLLAALLSLPLLQPWLKRLPYHLGVAAVLALVLVLTTLVATAGQALFTDYGTANLSLGRYWLISLGTAGVVLSYFHLRNRALSPAITEARLQALQARIRPHFLFNSLNAVLSLVRTDPQRAEQTLEDMADLFRVLMADNRHLTTLEKEVALCRQYLNIEQLRLGDRLYIAWRIDKMPREALVPPLVLQPLLENAVYHGIEPAEAPGEISINIYRSRDQVHLVIRNPYLQEGSHHTGNKMAIANVKERLQLHFDAEASLGAGVQGNSYQVHITLPYTTSE